MKAAFEAIFALIGAFVLIYAITHDGKLPHLVQQESHP